jgi:hypothetical protein
MKTTGNLFLKAALGSFMFFLTYCLFVDIFHPAPTIVIASDDREFREDVKYSLKIIENSKTGAHLIKELKRTGKTVFITSGERSMCVVQKSRMNNAKVALGIPIGSTIILGSADNVEFPLYIILAHEMQHALDLAQGKFINDTTKVRPGVSKLEESAMDLENAMEREFGYPVRERHDSH